MKKSVAIIYILSMLILAMLFMTALRAAEYYNDRYVCDGGYLGSVYNDSLMDIDRQVLFSVNVMKNHTSEGDLAKEIGINVSQLKLSRPMNLSEKYNDYTMNTVANVYNEKDMELTCAIGYVFPVGNRDEFMNIISQSNISYEYNWIENKTFILTLFAGEEVLLGSTKYGTFLEFSRASLNSPGVIIFNKLEDNTIRINTINMSVLAHSVSHDINFNAERMTLVLSRTWSKYELIVAPPNDLSYEILPYTIRYMKTEYPSCNVYNC